MEDLKFIEVSKVIADQEGYNSVVKKETLQLSEIKGAREWYKSHRDKVDGDMTVLVLEKKEPKKSSQIVDGQVFVEHKENKERIMLINENYNSFIDRLSFKVPVSRVQ